MESNDNRLYALTIFLTPLTFQDNTKQFMPYNEKLAGRIRAALSHILKVEEKKMFGGLAFMVDNKMCITAGADRIMCRIDPAIYGEAIKRKGCSTVIMGEREYKGYVYVNEDRIKNKIDFDYWIRLALEYNKIAKASKKANVK